MSPSGVKGKQIIKQLIHQVDSYQHFLMMIAKKEEAMTL